MREALFQLSREGLLNGNERGYVMPIYTKVDILHRLEVKRLLDPRLAQRAAIDAEPQQIKAMGKAHAREKAAHAAGKVKAFNTANQELRSIYRSMCKNDLLVRCLTLVDDQFEHARSRIHENADNRTSTIALDTRLLAAITARDPQATAAEMSAFLDFLDVYYAHHPVSEFG